jgi:hypothetical protein
MGMPNNSVFKVLNTKGIIHLIVLLFFCNFAHGFFVVLDSGHDPKFTGAKGNCGKNEVNYNDELVQEIVSKSNFQYHLTRQYGETLAHWVSNQPLPKAMTLNDSLQARTSIANRSQGDLFISIHHDSNSKRFIEFDRSLCSGRGGKKLNAAFLKKHRIGFNIFINENIDNEKGKASLEFAKILGQRLVNMNRTSSDYHYQPEDDCKSCKPLVAELGIWSQNLFVLRETFMPAVLIEVGNIIDTQDEALISSALFKANFSELLNLSVQEYFERNTKK